MPSISQSEESVIRPLGDQLNRAMVFFFYRGVVTEKNKKKGPRKLEQERFVPFFSFWSFQAFICLLSSSRASHSRALVLTTENVV